MTRTSSSDCAPYRCVFIDWHGTLSHSRFWEDQSDLAPLAQALFSPVGPCRKLLEPWMRGALTSEEVVRTVASATGIDYEVALDSLIASCQRMIVPAAVFEAIASLRKQGIKVVIATDNMDTFWRWTVPSLGLEQRFDAILSSAERKALKWDVDRAGRSLFFGDFLAREGIGPGEGVLLDDSAEAEGHIRGFGIDYLHIASPRGLLVALWYLQADHAVRTEPSERASWAAIRRAAAQRLFRPQ